MKKSTKFTSKIWHRDFIQKLVLLLVILNISAFLFTILPESKILNENTKYSNENNSNIIPLNIREPSSSNISPRDGPDLIDFNYLVCVGPSFNNSKIHLNHANVIIDCYEENSSALGLYFVENNENESLDLMISFISETTVKIDEILVNQIESIPLDNKAYFNIHLPSNSQTEISIRWSYSHKHSLNYHIYNGEDYFGEVAGTLELYCATYSINGGEYWGGVPIEWEEVRFNFHDDTFVRANNSALVNIQDSAKFCLLTPEKWFELREESEPTTLSIDENDVPYFLFRKENFTESFNIFIFNDNYEDNFVLGNLTPLKYPFAENFGNFTYLTSCYIDTINTVIPRFIDNNYIEIIDTSIPSDIQLVDVLYFPNEISYIKKISQSLLLIRDFQGSITFLNTSCPDSPQIITKYEHIEENLFIQDAIQNSNKLYILYGGYYSIILEIVDISDIQTPKHISYIDLIENNYIVNVSETIDNSEGYYQSNGRILNNLNYDNSRLYISGKLSYEISESGLNLNSKYEYFNDEWFERDYYGYVNNSILYSSNSSTLRIFNITEYDQPLLLSTVQYDVDIEEIKILDERIYALGRFSIENYYYSQLKIFNIEELTNPIEIVNYNMSYHPNFRYLKHQILGIENERFYLTSADSGYEVYNCSNIYDFHFLGRYMSYKRSYIYPAPPLTWFEKNQSYIIMFGTMGLVSIAIILYIVKENKKGKEKEQYFRPLVISKDIEGIDDRELIKGLPRFNKG